MYKKALTFILATGFLFTNAQQKFQNGIWRAVLERNDGKEIVFNFDVKDSAGKKIIHIHNASERLLADQITVTRDSVFITLPFFESQLRAAFVNENELNGTWLKRLVDKYQVTPFQAFYNQPERFKTNSNATANVSGRWAVTFLNAPKNEDVAVGEFVQTGNHVTGTFLNPTGDDRFLEGVMDGDSLRLSTFDGGHAFLFTAKVEGDKIIGGQYFSGPTFKQEWIAEKNENATLPDEFALTKMKEGQTKFDFAFRDIEGKTVSIHNARFKNKVVLLQLMGSWCPNCMDETPVLSKLYDHYKNKGVEIIGLAYERSTDFERSQKSLRTFQKRFNVNYTLLITGVSVNDSLRAEKTLPQLEKIEGFPTTIFINKRGEVEKIHTGFNGPGTGEHYDEQKKEFYDIVNTLLVK
ncbi:MAG: TlpA family protein disulfide reductase [Bacteroidetes bacterium]|nr:TlpA family protein disulfide reductase [Bacteroidota bacterium]